LRVIFCMVERRVVAPDVAVQFRSYPQI